MVILGSADCTSYFVPCHFSWFACWYQKVAIVWDSMDGICVVKVGLTYRADLDILSTPFVEMESRIHLHLQQRSKMCPISCHLKTPILLSSIRGTLGNQLRDWHPNWAYRWLSLMNPPPQFSEAELSLTSSLGLHTLTWRYWPQSSFGSKKSSQSQRYTGSFLSALGRLQLEWGLGQISST